MPVAAETKVDENQKWVDVKTASAYLDMPKRTVRHHCTTGELPARKIGSVWRIERAAVVPERKA
ncbi:hypothetical protein BSZ35_19050 [Salinibacter sp. 10B]|nr:hypothetical protein BSZ35_19050 [Salinibacter sp. 10B]